MQFAHRGADVAGFFFGFNSLVAMGSIVTVLWFGARQARPHAWQTRGSGFKT